MKFSITAAAALAALVSAETLYKNVTLAENATLAEIAPLEDIVTVYVTDCPVTTTDAAGNTVTTHTQSTVTSTVCPKCSKTETPKAEVSETPKSQPKPSPKAETPKSQQPKPYGNSTILLTQTLTHTLSKPSAPAQVPTQSVPAQANGAVKAAVGVAAVAVPMVMALM